MGDNGLNRTWSWPGLPLWNLWGSAPVGLCLGPFKLSTVGFSWPVTFEPYTSEMRNTIGYYLNAYLANRHLSECATKSFYCGEPYFVIADIPRYGNCSFWMSWGKQHTHWQQYWRHTIQTNAGRACTFKPNEAAINPPYWTSAAVRLDSDKLSRNISRTRALAPLVPCQAGNFLRLRSRALDSDCSSGLRNSYKRDRTINHVLNRCLHLVILVNGRLKCQ
jgi:hypothetical protein